MGRRRGRHVRLFTKRRKWRYGFEQFYLEISSVNSFLSFVIILERKDKKRSMLRSFLIDTGWQLNEVILQLCCRQRFATERRTNYLSVFSKTRKGKRERERGRGEGQ